MESSYHSRPEKSCAEPVLALSFRAIISAVKEKGANVRVANRPRRPGKLSVRLRAFPSGLRESHVHDVAITREAPN
ncbi:MAG: hypothetical protein EXR01_07100 [Acetobacteraceae bacterium]|nr:hypothetical protein [Acetobacteraceae bacterium]